MTLEEAKAILEALVQEDVQFVVIGAMAMAAQGLPRATHDLDLFVSPERGNVEALKRALRSHFDDPSIDEIDPDELAGDYPAVEYSPPHGRYSMDILTRLGEAFSWEDLAAGSDEVKLGQLTVRVASPSMLYRMKKDTVRPQDRVDAARIREVFDLDEES
jgi:Nucleotidyl transferase AbiEii toxin, Type IV TA system